MSSTGPEPQPEPADEREVEELRRRVAELEGATPSVGRRHHRLRTTGAVVLIVVASVLSMLAVLSTWIADTVTDTDRFVATMGPLASNPDVQKAVSSRITNVVVQQIDVPSLVNQLSQVATQAGVPPQAASLIGSLSGPIGSGLTSLIGTVVNKVVASDAFATVWTNGLRAAHSSIEKALTGQGGGAIQLSNNEVMIDVGPAVDKIKTQLVESGFGLAAKIPEVHTSITVFASSDIAKIRTYFRLLEILGNWLPVIAVLIAAGGVYLAVNRRRALIGTAIGVAVAMLVLGIAVAVFRSFFLDHLPSTASPGAAGAVYDALVHYLRKAVRSVGALAVLVALGAFFIGPSRVATTVRSACSTGVAAVRSAADSAGFKAGPVGPFVARYKRWIGIAILLVAAVIFVVWDNPTGMVAFWFAVVILVLFGIREFLAPGPGPAKPSAGEPALAGGTGAGGPGER
ncbi:hypothetical protein [Streptomyces kaniharaensis]|uniref:hypothetical protein n=1 Tax=Streptomyces kaniharaensis TaxID=212423 RepID=UPI001E5F29A4|nr:hypothetical protein [Streptomyces kaniharaensis]